MTASRNLLILLALCGCRWALSEGTELGGVVTTITDVQSFADLSQDLSSMQNLVSQGEPEEALGIYRDGLHSEAKPGFKRSFKSMADKMSAEEIKTPSYLFHLYGQADRELNLAFDQQKLNYINSEVEEAFQSKPSVGVEAVWILNVWMYATHLLYKGVYECEQRSKGENPDLFQIGMAGWDEFIALYVGSGQTPGATNGDSLYKWAQIYGEKMQTSPQGESIVNTRVKLLYQEAATIMNVEGSCTKSNPNTAGQLWKLVVQMVGELSKPLFQGLIYGLDQKDSDLVSIYAKALVPQLSKCRPSLYKRMHEALIINTFYVDTTTIEGVLNDIPESTECFGYHCSELGSTGISACDNADETPLNFAGYVPDTPVGAVAKADLDVYQIKLLTLLKTNEYAYFLYMHGANIAKFRQGNDPLEYVALHEIAVSSERSAAKPWFDHFVSYNGDKDYADKAIQNILLGNSKWKATQQISAIVGVTASYQILLLEAVTKLRIAVDECRDAENEDGPAFVLDPIDEAAALLVGSMEGEQLGGSSDLDDGQLVYNINNKHAFQFGTLNSGYSDAVSNIEDLLFAAKAQLDALDCNNLQHTTEEILRFSMIGIVQASIFLAEENSQLGEFSTAAGLAEAEGLGLAILPLIQQTDATTAEELKSNTVRLQGSQPVPSGAQQVGSLWGKGFTYTMMMECSHLGAIATVNPCDGAWGSAVFNRTPPGSGASSIDSILSVSTAVAAAVVAFLAL